MAILLHTAAGWRSSSSLEGSDQANINQGQIDEVTHQDRLVGGFVKYWKAALLLPGDDDGALSRHRSPQRLHQLVAVVPTEKRGSYISD